MSFHDIFNGSKIILTEGSVIERIRRESNLSPNPYISNAGFIYDAEKKVFLTALYKQYIDIGFSRNTPILIFTPTWRANRERLQQAGFSDKDVNRDCFLFLDNIRKSYGEYSKKIMIGGLMGCRGDAYNPSEALSTSKAIEFHKYQVEDLTNAGVDFLFAATVPAYTEALGMAISMAASCLPFIISFVINSNGTLLDGSSLHEVITSIDDSAIPKPFGYMVNCVHSTNFEKAITHEVNSSEAVRRRIIGLQANTSKKRPEELDGSAELDSEEPDIFAKAMVRLHERYGIKILGGCCGTDEKHIKAINENI